jgi:sodium-dependent dicarboxylate transporter 2/3/5
MALAVITVVAGTTGEIGSRQRGNFEKALLLGIAYAATIGGVSTLIGTPPNAFMAAFVEETYGIPVGFTQWMMVGMPLSLIMLPSAWFLLCHIVYPFNFTFSSQVLGTLKRSRSELGSVSTEEYLVMTVFACTALAWISRPILNNTDTFANLTDSTIAVVAGVAMFLLPSNRAKNGRLLDWNDTRKLPWGILILFGGALALAKGVTDSGLAQGLANMMTNLDALSMFFLIALFVTVVVFFTELASNLATTAAFLPVVGVLAVTLGIHPLMLIAPVAMGASCAFMMPVGTPPNAIVYSSEKVTIMQMAKAGLALNIIAILVVSIVSVLLVPRILTP